MKLTESTLRKIIKEELSKIISEGHDSAAVEEIVHNFIQRYQGLSNIARDFSSFGGVVKYDNLKYAVEKFVEEELGGGYSPSDIEDAATQISYQVQDHQIANVRKYKNDLNESITGNYWSDKAVMMSYFENVPTSNFDIVVGSIIFLLAATQAKEPLTAAFNMIKQYINTNKIGKEKEQAALKVAQLVQKYKDNPELVQLVQQRKLNEFVNKLKELEGSSSIDKSAGAGAYKGMKTHLGMPPKSA